MSKMKFLDKQEAEKVKKQKWDVFCWTPCNNKILSTTQCILLARAFICKDTVYYHIDIYTVVLWEINK